MRADRVAALAASIAYTPGVIAGEGDSIMRATIGPTVEANGWFQRTVTALAAHPLCAFTSTNLATNNETVADTNEDVAVIDALYTNGARIRRGSSRGNVVLFHMGTNDLHFGADETTTRARQNTWVNGRIAAGFTVLFFTMLSREGEPGQFETDRLANNAYWTGGAAARAGLVVCDWASDPLLASDGPNSADGIHPNDNGHLIMSNDYAYPAMLALLGLAS